MINNLFLIKKQKKMNSRLFIKKYITVTNISRHFSITNILSAILGTFVACLIKFTPLGTIFLTALNICPTNMYEYILGSIGGLSFRFAVKGVIEEVIKSFFSDTFMIRIEDILNPQTPTPEPTQAPAPAPAQPPTPAPAQPNNVGYNNGQINPDTG